MPRRPTTHKDLHRAAIGSVLSLVYLLAMPGVWSSKHSTGGVCWVIGEGRTGKACKNEPAKPNVVSSVKVAVPAKTVARTQSEPSSKPTAPAKAVIAPLKPLSSATTAGVVLDVKSPQPKAGKLREIPLSSLDVDKALSTSKSIKVEAKPDGEDCKTG